MLLAGDHFIVWVLSLIFLQTKGLEMTFSENSLSSLLVKRSFVCESAMINKEEA